MKPVRCLLVMLLLVTSSCATSGGQTMPMCESSSRLAIVAQAVPDGAYVPCIEVLPPGWAFAGLEVQDGEATLSLESDRADRDVTVRYEASCNVARATPITPSDVGVRTYHIVESIDPRYSGRLLDVFPNGCVTTSYDFERGPHVALVTELRDAVELFPRRQLRRELEDDLGVTLDS